jgi:hypothetical protein
VDLCRFFFIEALESPVMSLVNFPVLVNLCVLFQVHTLKDQIASLSRSIQHRGVSDVERVPKLFKRFPGISGLLAALFRKRDVYPSCEFATFIPGGFAMPDKHNLNCVGFWFISFWIEDFADIYIFKIRHFWSCLMGPLKELNLLFMEITGVYGQRDVTKQPMGFGHLLEVMGLCFRFEV